MSKTESQGERFSAVYLRDDLLAFTEALNSVVDEAKFHFDHDSLWVKAVDPANVAMINPTLSGVGDRIEEASGDSQLVGINTTRLEDILRAFPAGEKVDVTVDTIDTKVYLWCAGTEYALAYIDPDSVRQEPNLKTYDLPVTLEFEARKLTSAIELADIVSDKIVFAYSVDQSTFTMDSEGEIDEVMLELDGEDLATTTAEDGAHSLMTLDYLKHAVEPVPEDEIVTLRLGNGYPLELEYSPSPNVEVEYTQAPRITGVDDE